MRNLYTGYQGFRAAGQSFAPSLKPGETYEARDNKYSKMGGGVGNEGRERPQALPTMTTCSQEASSHVQREDYRIPDRRGVSVSHSSENLLERSKPFLHDSVYENDFTNFSKDVEQLGKYLVPAGKKDGGVCDIFKQEFDRMDKGSGTIDIRDVPRVIEGALGRDVRPWIKDRMLKAFEKNIVGRVSWLDLQDGLRKVQEFAKAEASQKERVVPEWVVPNHKPAVTHGEVLQSCYQKDIGKYGEFPRNRRVWYKRGMFSTSLDLFQGTTKETYHVPGYGGFMPASKTNARAREHGDMLKPRSKRPDSLLFYSHNTLGYTGHAPAAMCNDRGPARCGSNPLTTSGAAELGMMM